MTKVRIKSGQIWKEKKDGKYIVIGKRNNGKWNAVYENMDAHTLTEGTIFKNYELVDKKSFANNTKNLTASSYRKPKQRNKNTLGFPDDAIEPYCIYEKGHCYFINFVDKFPIHYCLKSGYWCWLNAFQHPADILKYFKNKI